MTYRPANPNGQALMIDSAPVVIASNQSALPVTGTFWQATQPVSGTVTANIGTIAGLATEVTVAAINGKMAPLGQALMAASMPVVIASNQSAIPVTGTFWQATQPVSGPLTDVQLRASAVPVSGPLTDAQLRATAVPVSIAGNQAVNLTQLAGTAVSVNSGNKDAGTQRTVIATDQLAVPLWGQGATGAAVPANIQYIGGRAATANPTAVTNGQAVGVMTDKQGRVVIAKENPRDLTGDQRTAVAAVAETTVVTAGAAGVFRDITWILITTAGAAAQTITFRDATGAGPTRLVLNYPNAALAPSAPLFLKFDPPLKQTTAANNWTVVQGAATSCNYNIGYVERT